MALPPSAAPALPFTAEERRAFEREDRQATTAVFVLAVSVFLFGIVLYAIVLVACL